MSKTLCPAIKCVWGDCRRNGAMFCLLPSCPHQKQLLHSVAQEMGQLMALPELTPKQQARMDYLDYLDGLMHQLAGDGGV